MSKATWIFPNSTHQSKIILALSSIWQFMVNGKENSEHYHSEGRYCGSGNMARDLITELQNQTKTEHKT